LATELRADGHHREQKEQYVVIPKGKRGEEAKSGYPRPGID
jgi:hypothetical protein